MVCVTAFFLWRENNKLLVSSNYHSRMVLRCYGRLEGCYYGQGRPCSLPATDRSANRGVRIGVHRNRVYKTVGTVIYRADSGLRKTGGLKLRAVTRSVTHYWFLLSHERFLRITSHFSGMPAK